MREKDLPNNSALIVNNFLLKKSLNKQSSSNLSCNNIGYIIGSPLSEAGVCSREDEFKHLKKMALWIKYFDSGRNLVYIPHRREESDKLKIIKEIFKCDINNELIPIELKIPSSKAQVFYGTYSSCFETLYSLEDTCKIKSFKIDHIVNDKWKKFVSRQYEDYKILSNIEIINV